MCTRSIGLPTRFSHFRFRPNLFGCSKQFRGVYPRLVSGRCERSTNAQRVDIRATRERGVGVPTASREANSLYGENRHALGRNYSCSCVRPH